MPWDGYPTTLFKAIRLVTGKNVCIDTEHLHATTKVVKSLGEYEHFIADGWSEHPTEALERLDKAQDEQSTNAAVRAYDDRHLSEAAQAEVAAVEQTTVEHLEAIPEGPKKRGRKPKGA